MTNDGTIAILKETEKRKNLQVLYGNVHIDRQDRFEELKNLTRKYLSHVKFKEKFPIIPCEAYLKEIFRRTHHKTPEAFSQIQKGFHNLEKYGIKLLQCPWRKEFQTVKLYSAFFKHEIEPNIPIMFSKGILQFFGYKSGSHKDVFAFDENISLDSILTTAFELFLITIELEVMLEIANEIELYDNSTTLDDILEVRMNTIGDVREAKELLFKIKHIPPERKKIKLDSSKIQDNKPKNYDHKRYESKDAYHVSTRSFPAGTSSDHSSSKKDPRISQAPRVSHISTANHIENLTESEMYLNDFDVIGKEELSRAGTTPTFSNHYPQSASDKYYSMDMRDKDYISMSGIYEDKDYMSMNLHNEYSELPPPSYDEALSIKPKPENLPTEWVVINSNEPSLPGDGVTSTMHGISELKIKDNGFQHIGGKSRYNLRSDRKQDRNEKYELQSLHSSGPFTRQKKQESAYIKSSNGLDKQVSRPNATSSEPSVPRTRSSRARDEKFKTADKSGLDNVKHPPSSKSEPKYLSKDKQQGKKIEKERCEFCPEEATITCVYCEKQCCTDCKGFIGTLPCEGAKVHCLFERKCTDCETRPHYKCGKCGKKLCTKCFCKPDVMYQKCNSHSTHDFKLINSLTNKIHEDEKSKQAKKTTEMCGFCTKKSKNECKMCKIKSCDLCKVVQQTKGKCQSKIGHIFLPMESSKPPTVHSNYISPNVCEFCQAGTAIFICADCRCLVCTQCRYIYNQDHCPTTKKDHFFQVITSETKVEPKQEPWSCGRCTFSNPPQNKICAMCATSKGVTGVELPESGSRRCMHCTYGNAKDARICKMCSKPLANSQVESYI